MATSTANITSGHAIVGDSSVTAQELEDAVEKAVVGDFSRDHVASGASIPAIGTTAPTTDLLTGEVWVDPTDPLDTGTTKTHILKTYNGSVFRAGVVAWHIGSTAPTYTAGRGMGWYDSTNKVKRLYATIDGLTGWHPVDRGVALMTNNHASTCPLGGVVKSDDTTNGFTMTTTKKDMKVIGVALEQITAAATGLVALVTSGMEVEVLCDDASADATVAAGDLLVSFSVIGEARGVGPMISDPNISTAAIQTGVPMGAFAMALEIKSASHLARSRLLGHVGQGAWRQITPTKLAVLSDFVVGTWKEIDLTSYPQTGSILANADHAPLVAVGIMSEAESVAAAGAIELLTEFSPDRTAVYRHWSKGQATSGSTILGDTFGETVVPTKTDNASGYNALGNVLQAKLTETTSTFTSMDVYATRYMF